MAATIVTVLLVLFSSSVSSIPLAACPPFADNIKVVKCEGFLFPTCEITCRDGYAPASRLFKEKHPKLPNFDTKCTLDYEMTFWNPGPFSCVTKEEVIRECFAAKELEQALQCDYPEKYLVQLFSEVAQTNASEKKDQTGGGRETSSATYENDCTESCARESNGDFTYSCWEIGVYLCLSCRLTGAKCAVQDPLGK